MNRYISKDSARPKTKIFYRLVSVPSNSIAHNEIMSTKRKAGQDPNETARGSAGRRSKRDTVDDVVKLVHFSFRTVLLKSDMVVCEFADATSSFADLENHFLCEVYTNTISESAGDRQQSYM